MIRVVIADDHHLVRAGLEHLLTTAEDMSVVGVASGGREAVLLATATAADVVLMDLMMPDLDGVAATRELTTRAPACGVLVLASFGEEARVAEALDAGAIAYLLKEAEPEEILHGIRAAARGESRVVPKRTQRFRPSRTAPTPFDDLTERQREVLALLAQGHPNKAIARRLHVAEATVKHHLSRIFQILDVADRTQAALWAQREGLDRPTSTSRS